MKSREYAWEQKYRSKVIDDIILKEEHRLLFDGIIRENRIPNMILYGPPGLGKTTTALVLVNQLNKDYLFLNGRTEGKIDILENKVTEFISTKSFNGQEKVVIFDEGDEASHSVRAALKTMIETFSKNASFIITSNHINVFQDAFRSRMKMVNFSLPTNEEKIKALQKQIFIKVIKILKNENVVVEDTQQLANYIKKSYRDIRNIIKTLHSFSIMYNKKIPSTICEEADVFNTDSFIKLLNEFKYDEIIKFVENNNSEMIYVFIQDNIKELTKPDNYYDVLRIINAYSFQESFTMTKSANTVCCLKELKEYIKGV